ncbi:Gfo/Idh/MocA family oxidoreductase [Candidatus Bathyarchaeota archaeon]|nr:Gfo/Idh/MocA family oxidoreductase [Candidatus Bathyarchaeota archaeon]
MESRPSVKAGEKEGSPVRFGILSTAMINAAGLIHPVETHPGAVITAIASRDIKKAESAARTYGIEKAYGCYDDLLGDENIDAVYISLPNGMHAGRSSFAYPLARRLRALTPCRMDGKGSRCGKTRLTREAPRRKRR